MNDKRIKILQCYTKFKGEYCITKVERKLKNEKRLKEKGGKGGKDFSLGAFRSRNIRTIKNILLTLTFPPSHTCFPYLSTVPSSRAIPWTIGFPWN